MAFRVDVYNRCERCECSTTLYIESMSISLRKYINSLSADLQATRTAKPHFSPACLRKKCKRESGKDGLVALRRQSRGRPDGHIAFFSNAEHPCPPTKCTLGPKSHVRYPPTILLLRVCRLFLQYSYGCPMVSLGVQLLICAGVVECGLCLGNIGCAFWRICCQVESRFRQ